jgi:hypothetical protein
VAARDEPGRAPRYEDEVSSLNAQISFLAEEIIVLRRRLADSPRQVRLLEERLRETQASLTSVMRQNARLASQLRVAKDALAGLQKSRFLPVLPLPERAFEVGPSTERIIVNLDAPELGSRAAARLAIARLVMELRTLEPNAGIRIVVPGYDESLSVPDAATLAECEAAVRELLGRLAGPPTQGTAMPGTQPTAGPHTPDRLIVEIDKPAFQPASRASARTVTVYISDQSVHQQVEAAVDELLASAGLLIESRDEPVIGSWFRKMRAGVDEIVQSPRGREAVLTATHVVDSRLVLAQDAYVTATFLQNLGPVIESLQPTRDAVLRIGALLLVKVDWTVQVFQLTAAQQAVLDHQPYLAMRPQEIIDALRLRAAEPDQMQAAAEPETPAT